ncbi:MAG: hypothetical protein GEEBNDBF_00899 [bacterium]|nr:hypothetical protein [bacterium]
MPVKRTLAWSALLLFGGLLLLGCQTETASPRDEHVAATVGSAQVPTPGVLPNGLDTLNLSPDLKLAEQQIFLLANTPRGLWDLITVRTGEPPATADALLGALCTWPVMPDTKPWNLALPGQSLVAPGVALEATPTGEIQRWLSQGAAEFGVNTYDFPAGDYLQKHRQDLEAQAAADPNSWVIYRAADLLRPVALYAMRYGEYPETVDASFEQLQIGVDFRKVQEVLALHPAAAYWRSADGTQVALVLEGGAAQPWLVQHRIRQPQPSGAIAWTNGMKKVEKFKAGATLWLPLADLKAQSLQLPEDLLGIGSVPEAATDASNGQTMQPR